MVIGRSPAAHTLAERLGRRRGASALLLGPGDPFEGIETELQPGLDFRRLRWPGDDAPHASGSSGVWPFTHRGSATPLYHAFVAAARQYAMPATALRSPRSRSGAPRWATHYARRMAAKPTALLLQRGRVIGVRFEEAGQSLAVEAKAEVIIVGGAVESARLLMLSGIGSPRKLATLNIDPEVDLPGVGDGLHVGVLVERRYRRAARYSRGRGEPGWRAGGHVMAGDVPCQVLFSSTRDAFAIGAVPLRLRSRGNVALRSRDPSLPPIINPNALGDDDDLADALDALRLVDGVARQVALDPFRGEPLYPDNWLADRNDWTNLRATTTITGIPAGTCAMGRVVDEEYRVYGTANLRVCDASVLTDPIPPLGDDGRLRMVEHLAELLAVEPSIASR